MRVGIIGAGNMGSAFARRLSGAGHDVIITSRTLDEAKRTQALRKAEQIYVVDDPARVWYRFRVSELTTAKRVQGLEVYPDGIVRLQYARVR